MIIGAGNVVNPEQGTADFSIGFSDTIENVLDQQVSDLFINSLPGSFFVMDENRRFIRWNKKHQEILGFSPKELLSMDAIKIIVEEERDSILKKIKEGFLKDSSSIETKIQTKSGQKIPYYLTGNLIKIGQQRYLLGFGIEITQLKEAQEEIRRRNEELESIVSVSRAMRATSSLKEFYETVLKQISNLFNADGTAICLHDIINNEDTIELGCCAWSHWTGENINNNPDLIDFETPYQVNLPIPDEEPGIVWKSILRLPLVVNNQLLGALWVGRQTSIDVTELQLLQAICDMAANAIHRQLLFEDLQVQLKTLHKTRAQLVQSEKLAAIGELVAGVAHEINNPLTSILLYARMMQQNSDGEMDQNVDIIVKESQRAAKIVRGLLDFSRQYPSEKRPVNVNEIINASLNILSFELSSHHVSCNLDFASPLPVVLADPIQLQQVFINIINNAWQATSMLEKPGVLTISTYTAPAICIEKNNPSPNALHIVFSNSGPAIDPENLSRIFDPFFTTKTDGKGTGLGLAISHGIIGEHGGHIWAENISDGVSFHIELPASSLPFESEEITPSIIKKEDNAQDVKRASILVIDDETVILDIISRLLRKSGYNVDTSTDGNDAFILLKHKRYDVIICDIRMPGLNGPEFYARVQQTYPALIKHIIFTTGDLISSNINSFLEKTGVAFLAKPFELEQLIKLVNAILDFENE
ncbi:MAG: response regulator [Anaerolineae bacterium]|nr:response regulator [Anaerolineae bacterium]